MPVTQHCLYISSSYGRLEVVMGGELAPAPVSYGALTRRAAQEICEAENGYLSGVLPRKN